MYRLLSWPCHKANDRGPTGLSSISISLYHKTICDKIWFLEEGKWCSAYFLPTQMSWAVSGVMKPGHDNGLVVKLPACLPACIQGPCETLFCLCKGWQTMEKTLLLSPYSPIRLYHFKETRFCYLPILSQTILFHFLFIFFWLQYWIPESLFSGQRTLDYKTERENQSNDATVNKQ